MKFVMAAKEIEVFDQKHGTEFYIYAIPEGANPEDFLQKIIDFPTTEGLVLRFSTLMNMQTLNLQFKQLISLKDFYHQNDIYSYQVPGQIPLFGNTLLNIPHGDIHGFCEVNTTFQIPTDLESEYISQNLSIER